MSQNFNRKSDKNYGKNGVFLCFMTPIRLHGLCSVSGESWIVKFIQVLYNAVSTAEDM
jgi:hypothetical protein